METCSYCGGNCPNEPDDSENLCDGFAGAIDDLDSEPEPQEDDYQTEDYQKFYQYGKLVVEVPDGEDWEPYVKSHMMKNNFFPSVFAISDHGNSCLLHWDFDATEPI